jgi:hypothetical protein
MSWFTRGTANIEAKVKKGAEERQKRAEARGPRRFYVQNDSSKKFTFLDNPEFLYQEHNAQINGKWGNFFTCIRDHASKCPACISIGKQGADCLAATVIDHGSWVDKKTGKKRQHEKSLIVFKGKALERILKQIKKRGDLTHCTFEASRTASPTEASTGEAFEFEKKRSIEKLKSLCPETWLKQCKEKGMNKEQAIESYINPYNYPKVFKPLELNELEEIFGPVGKVIGAEDDSWDDEDDDLDEDTKPSKPKKPAAEDDDDFGDDEESVPFDTDDEEEEEPEKPVKPAKKPAKPKKPEPEPEEDEDEPEDEPEEKPKQRRPRRQPAEKPAKAKKPVPVDEADELDDLIDDDD